MKLDKKENRLRRARKARAKIRQLEVNRLSVHRTPQHIYAQIIAADGATVLVSASTLETEVRKGVKSGGNVEAAAIVGARIAEKAKAAGIDSVAFDRSGFRYHGRVKALAEAAREAGLKF
jgi:large subunit ribosomal protein L18